MLHGKQPRWRSPVVWTSSFAFIIFTLRMSFPDIRFDVQVLNTAFDLLLVALIEIGILNSSTDPDHF